MSIYAYLSVVVIFAVGAPNSLEVEHVEVHIDIVFFDQLYGELTFIVSEGAELLILARRSPWLQIG